MKLVGPSDLYQDFTFSWITHCLLTHVPGARCHMQHACEYAIRHACELKFNKLFNGIWSCTLKNAALLKHLLRGDSMLQTLHSDTKINILNPNLDVKMFIKGVQTYLESIFSVPFVPNKKMLWLALKTLKVWVEESVLRTLQFKQPLFKVTFFKEIFLWILSLEQKITVPTKHNNN